MYSFSWYRKSSTSITLNHMQCIMHLWFVKNAADYETGDSNLVLPAHQPTSMHSVRTLCCCLKRSRHRASHWHIPWPPTILLAVTYCARACDQMAMQEFGWKHVLNHDERHLWYLIQIEDWCIDHVRSLHSPIKLPKCTEQTNRYNIQRHIPPNDWNANEVESRHLQLPWHCDSAKCFVSPCRRLARSEGFLHEITDLSCTSPK